VYGALPRTSFAPVAEVRVMNDAFLYATEVQLHQAGTFN
jgi:hypothetical protein